MWSWASMRIMSIVFLVVMFMQQQVGATRNKVHVNNNGGLEMELLERQQQQAADRVECLPGQPSDVNTYQNGFINMRTCSSWSPLLVSDSLTPTPPMISPSLEMNWQPTTRTCSW